MNRSRMYRDIFLAAGFAALIGPGGCVSKKAVVWHGQFATITTSDKPKEDFPVGSYIVVAFANVAMDTPYQFVILENGRQVGVITLDDYDVLEVYGCRYLLQEEGVERGGKIPYKTKFESHLVYQMYRVLPSYEKLKDDVSRILSGQHLEDPH